MLKTLLPRKLTREQKEMLLDILSNLEHVKFYGEWTQSSCHGMYSLSAQDLIDYIETPYKLIAKYNGVTHEDFLLWMNAENVLGCGALTKKGKPCKNIIAVYVSVSDWVERQGEYCYLHRGR